MHWTSIFIVAVVAIVVIYCMSIICSVLERKRWNKGYCPRCGTKWKFFDYDSTGARGYTCDKCNNKLWLSYLNFNNDNDKK